MPIDGSKPRNTFTGSRNYWIERYDSGKDSGPGSKGIFAAFKAEVINDFVLRNRIQSVIEYGCGDGNQLRLRYVIIHSYDTEDHPKDTAPHVRHRKFSRWVENMKPEWRLIAHVPNPLRGFLNSFSDGKNTALYPDFFIYEKRV